MSGFFNRLFSKEFFKRDITMSLAFALVFSVFFSLAGFDMRCQELRDNILRLHIIANSDSDVDQALKLRVRDEILRVSDGLFENSGNKEQAIDTAGRNIKVLKSAAEEVIKEQGKSYPVQISIGKANFGTRVYDGFTLPAGEYDAVRVLIGKAEGKNWWCVMFPSMCIPAAGEKHSIKEVVNSDSAEIAENPVKYEIKFKSVEIYEKIRQKIGKIFS